MRTFKIIHWTSIPREKEIKDLMANEDFREYIDDYGYHFTDSLANYVIKGMVPADGNSICIPVSQAKEIMKASGITLREGWTWGDATYLYNMAKMDFFPDVLKTAQDVSMYVKKVINDPDGYNEIAFSRWLSDVIAKDIDIDWDIFLY